MFMYQKQKGFQKHIMNLSSFKRPLKTIKFQQQPDKTGLLTKIKEILDIAQLIQQNRHYL
jgi:hypothetical protein